MFIQTPLVYLIENLAPKVYRNDVNYDAKGRPNLSVFFTWHYAKKLG